MGMTQPRLQGRSLQSLHREWITHICPYICPHLFENLLYKVCMIVFPCFLRNSNSINEVVFGPKIELFFSNGIFP